jgi:hypothetical protein
MPSEPVDLAEARRERHASLAAQQKSLAHEEADDERERVAWQRRAELALVEVPERR